MVTRASAGLLLLAAAALVSGVATAAAPASSGSTTAASTTAAATAAAATAAAATSAAPSSAAAAVAMAIVVHDAAPLRAGPRDSAQTHTQLWRGELVEVRGERSDYVQVWDHGRERGGFVRARDVRRLALGAADAPELLAVVRFLRDTWGAEALGIGYAAAWIRAAPTAAVNGEAGVEVLDALGTFAERLARRASAGASAGTAGSKAAEAALSAHLDVAARYGVRFASYERETQTQQTRMQICYDGEAFRRVLAMTAGAQQRAGATNAQQRGETTSAQLRGETTSAQQRGETTSAQQRARAALALTRAECIDPALGVGERVKRDLWRAEVLELADPQNVPAVLRNRLAMRQAGVWSSVAFQRARQGEAAAASAAAQRALSALAAVERSELSDDDQALHAEAAIRVGASRWAVVGERSGVEGAGGQAVDPAKALAVAAHAITTPAGLAGTRRPTIVTAPGEPGQTCVLLLDAKQDVRNPLARRCTYGLVWMASASVNREGTAAALAVQPLDSWRELWVFRKQGSVWSIDVLPPTAGGPELGYIEFAGWVPGGAQLLVARESRVEGRQRRSFDVLRLDTLAAERQSPDPVQLGAFQRWQDAQWKRDSVSLR
jgi:hypothetical protein